MPFLVVCGLEITRVRANTIQIFEGTWFQVRFGEITMTLY
ncbi:hypothetical protein HMPREF0044_1459 [Gleimia coleocanis DSM 15436]|uniref:Uncharacterized protein n=1 Tax=Gleimia coleocanis DSM 15436 TaxID=525245 RepID=C0W206_9ACTO|nr:hypothetical protein HMPREF0044_1459 [Gleimia coleocanis DSM 15436]